MNYTSENILEDAQDIKVIGRSTKKGMNIYAVIASKEAMKQFYDESISDPEDANVPVFNEYWRFHDGRISGGSVPLNLRFDVRALRPRGLWLPGIEGMNLPQSNHCQIYGVDLYDGRGKNPEIAQRLVSQASDLGLELPLAIPFRALNYAHDADKVLGIDVSFSDPSCVISGYEAVMRLREFNSNNANKKSHQDQLWRDVSGLGCLFYHRSVDLGFDVFGGFFTNLENITDSEKSTGLDWICGEATKEELIEANRALYRRRNDSKMEEADRRLQESLR
jgi:hypothetical protein